MRWMTGVTLGCVALLAGCLGAESVHCPGGFTCPAGTTCARAPTFCAQEEQVAACDGNAIPDTEGCAYEGVTDGACRGGACLPCSTALAGCTNPGWVVMDSKTEAPLYGVWAADRDEVYAVGFDTILRYDGLTWSPEQVTGADAGTVFTSVWGSDPEHVFATTGAGAIYQKSAAGPWTEVYRDVTPLNAIGGSGPSDVVAVSSEGSIVRSVGTGWRSEPVTNAAYSLYGVSARTQDDVFAVGVGGLILHDTGMPTWDPVQSYDANLYKQLRAVTTTALTTFAIGEGDGDTFTRLYSRPAGALGAAPFTRTVVPGVDSTIFNGIWATADDEVFAVGKGGAVVRRDSMWSAEKVGQENLHAVHGTDRRSVFAVGGRGTILHYSGQ